MTIEGTLAEQFTFNTLICKYSESGGIRKGFDLFNFMNTLGGFPDQDTYNSLINGLNKNLLSENLLWFYIECWEMVLFQNMPNILL